MSRSVARPTVHAPDAPGHVVNVMETWLDRTAARGQPFQDGDEFNGAIFRLGMLVYAGYLLLVPMYLLYEMAILAIMITGRRRAKQEEAAAAE